MIGTQSPAVVYVVRNDNDEPIYVGMTSRLKKRLNQHKYNSDWYNEACGIDLHYFPLRFFASMVERTLICRMKPKYNIARDRRRPMRSLLAKVQEKTP
jgi:excinuclease UvrABC nuclease subunit